MSEKDIIEIYKEGIDAVITLVQDMHNDLTQQISALKQENQKLNKGRTLEKIETPDDVIDIRTEHCNCGCNLADIVGTVRTRQVFEIPEIKIKVTEYRTHEVECPICRKFRKTEFP